MLLEHARAEVVRYAQRMERDELTVATSGNLSVREADLVAITPSGVDYQQLTPELVSVCDLNGKLVDGELAPSSELAMHLGAYASGSVGAVVHPHSMYATVLSTLVDELPPIHYLIALFGGSVRVARYETYGTEALANAVQEALIDRNAALIGNHGSITVGHDIGTAYTRGIYLEWVAKVYYLASRGGDPNILAGEEIDRVMEKIQGYGQGSPAS